MPSRPAPATTTAATTTAASTSGSMTRPGRSCSPSFDNGPQMTSGSTREFLALCAIAQHFGRPGTPTDQAWIESLNGHIKAEYPHLLAIRDPATLRAELAAVRTHYNTVRLHAGIGYVTPDDEHHGRGETIRKARQAGLEHARLQRLAQRRHQRENQSSQDPGDVV
jgi:putative transposase